MTKTTKLPVTERVSSIEDAYTETGHTFEERRPYAEPISDYQRLMNAIADEIVLAEALNEGRTSPYGTYGYIPVFRKPDHPSGFGLAYVDGGWADALSLVGSHRSFVEAHLARHAGEKFESLYRIIHSPIAK